jgi:glycosyltransferase involved in cell wall biosynthesis
MQGTQALVGRTCRLLAEAGHDVHLLCYAHARFERTEPFTVHRIADRPRFDSARSGLAWQKPILDARVARACRAMCAEISFDLIHAHHYEALLAARLADPRLRLPLLFHLHAMMGPELAGYFPLPLGPAARLAGVALDRSSRRLCDHVLAVSGSVLAMAVEAGTPPSMITVGLPPADAAPEAPPPRPAGTGLLAVYTGNLDAYQGLEVLLRALAMLPRDVASILRLRIATASDPASLARELERLDLDRMVEIQPQDGPEDAWRSLAGADMTVVPRSSPGGFPMKILNSLAAGVPVLADADVCRELAGGEHAWLVDMRDPRALANGLGELARDPRLRERLSAGGKAAAAGPFSAGRYLRSLEEAYRGARARWESTAR